METFHLYPICTTLETLHLYPICTTLLQLLILYVHVASLVIEESFFVEQVIEESYCILQLHFCNIYA
jgi:hypothetical protein